MGSIPTYPPSIIFVGIYNPENDMKADQRDLRDISKSLKDDGMRCNCDLDTWEPERTTGHSHLCRIHNRAMTMKYKPYDLVSG